MTEVWYSRGTLSVAQLKNEINEIWAELQTDDQLRRSLATAGIDEAVTSDLNPNEAIRLRFQLDRSRDRLASLLVGWVAWR